MEQSKVAVRYFSKSGNTKKLADEIAKTAGCEEICNRNYCGTPLKRTLMDRLINIRKPDMMQKTRRNCRCTIYF